MNVAASRIETFREFYARLVTATAGVSTDAERLISAFRSVPREQFVGGGPWSVFTPVGYIQTPMDDPAVLYQDIVVSLIDGGPINNGQPSLHAACLASLGPMVDETGLHIGAGTGYYTAILAHMVERQGRIQATRSSPSLPTGPPTTWPRSLK
jgi:protein-L-isoaspartate(D-aspartate) O-methyltransferase